MVVLCGVCANSPAITRAEVERLIPALIEVESGGQSEAVGDGGNAIGVLQIWPIMVQDVNRITGKRYTLADRKCPVKAVEMGGLTHEKDNHDQEETSGIRPRAA